MVTCYAHHKHSDHQNIPRQSADMKRIERIKIIATQGNGNTTDVAEQSDEKSQHADMK